MTHQIVKGLVILLTLLYPLLVYFGLAALGPGVFGAALAALMVARLASLSAQEKQRLLLPLLGIMLYALIVAVTGSERMLRFYPVTVSLLLLWLFAESLINGPPLIERLVRARGIHISKHGIPYIRRVTQLWCVFFGLNALIATYTALASPLKWWALYNGLISYLAMGTLMGGELLVRRWYKRRMGMIDADGSGA